MREREREREREKGKDSKKLNEIEIAGLNKRENVNQWLRENERGWRQYERE